MRHLVALSLFAIAAAGCAGEIPGDESDSQEIDNGDQVGESEAALASVGGKATVTATSGLNLRTGAGTNYAVIVTMPHGAVVSVLAVSGGWYKVSWSGHTGWCSGMYLTPAAGGGGSAGGSSAVSAAMSRAASGVGFSYHWGAGCWSPGGAHGACYGSCPNCSHSGTWGADCSGYVAKVWQVPGTSAVSSCSHPYSTYNFYNQATHWATVPRSSARRGDAFVHNSAGSGHIFIYDSGDAWGNIVAYEAKGCSYGILRDTRTASSAYKVIRRDGY